MTPRGAAHDLRWPALLRAWAGPALVVLSRAYRAMVLTLVAIATLPLLWGWSAFVVRSGSMQPALGIGDVVVSRPVSASDPSPLGRVMVVARPGVEPLVHRVVGGTRDGYTTAGDANPTPDTTPVPADQLDGRAVLVVPFIGQPVLWAREGRVAALTAWLVLSSAAFVAAGRLGIPRFSRRQGRGGRRGRAQLVVPALLVGLAGPAVLSLTDSPMARAGFTGSTATRPNTWKVSAKPRQRYVAAVLADNPLAFYLLDEAGGGVAADRSVTNWPGVLNGVSAYRQPGALPNNPGYSLRLDGGNVGLMNSGGATSNPTTFSVELWFRTTTTTGGKLIGFENTQGSSSSKADRHVFMRDDGRLAYGGWASTLGTTTIVTPAAYNDGAWHQLVLTSTLVNGQQQGVLYVDGASVASGVVTPVSSFGGWWRIGSGTLPTGPGYPTSSGFEGYLDNISGYWTLLSGAQVKTHWAAR